MARKLEHEQCALITDFDAPLPILDFVGRYGELQPLLRNGRYITDVGEQQRTELPKGKFRLNCLARNFGEYPLFCKETGEYVLLGDFIHGQNIPARLQSILKKLRYPAQRCIRSVRLICGQHAGVFGEQTLQHPVQPPFFTLEIKLHSLEGEEIKLSHNLHTPQHYNQLKQYFHYHGAKDRNVTVFNIHNQPDQHFGDEEPEEPSEQWFVTEDGAVWEVEAETSDEEILRWMQDRYWMSCAEIITHRTDLRGEKKWDYLPEISHVTKEQLRQLILAVRHHFGIDIQQILSGKNRPILTPEDLRLKISSKATFLIPKSSESIVATFRQGMRKQFEQCIRKLKGWALMTGSQLEFDVENMTLRYIPRIIDKLHNHDAIMGLIYEHIGDPHIQKSHVN